MATGVITALSGEHGLLAEASLTTVDTATLTWYTADETFDNVIEDPPLTGNGWSGLDISALETEERDFLALSLGTVAFLLRPECSLGLGS